MPALRVACLTPWGEHHDLVALRGLVVVPRELGHMPSLWWLGEEHHPRLAVTAVSELERETGTELGLSPYCVPIERWNQVADRDAWLPVVPASAGTVAVDGIEAPGSGGLESLTLPARARSSADTDPERNGFRTSGLDRLRTGSAAVAGLFGGMRAAVVAGLHGTAVLACGYYVVAAAVWLWALRDGMNGEEIQHGALLVLVALLLSAATGLLRERAPTGLGTRVALPPSDGRDRQPLAYTALDAYRVGILLQLLAFGAFVMF